MQKLLTLPERFPFIGLPHALILLRVVTALLFMIHAATRIVLGTIPQFALFMGHQGFPYPTLWVWAITLAELVAGSCLIIGWRVRLMCIPLFTIAGVGILLIHRHLGWFVGEHGTGGSEYSVALMAMLIVVAASDGAGKYNAASSKGVN